MSARLRQIAAAVLVVALHLAGCGARDDRASAAPPSPTAAPTQHPAGAETVEATGLIMGVGIGMRMSEAREKLDALRSPNQGPPDAKEEAGKRIYWKLEGTEYDWIMAWANSAEQITRIRAMLRPDHRKPFSAIGDLETAVARTPQQAMWNITPPDKPAFRLIAQGDNEQAITFYMFALGLEMR